MANYEGGDRARHGPAYRRQTHTTLPGERTAAELAAINHLRGLQGLPPLGGPALHTAQPAAPLIDPMPGGGRHPLPPYSEGPFPFFPFLPHPGGAVDPGHPGYPGYGIPEGQPPGISPGGGQPIEGLPPRYRPPVHIGPTPDYGIPEGPPGGLVAHPIAHVLLHPAVPAGAPSRPTPPAPNPLLARLLQMLEQRHSSGRRATPASY